MSRDGNKRRLIMTLGICVGTVAMVVPVSAQSVFINEIHYDNSGSDAGEAIEIAGAGGTSLAGWSVAFYNGSASQLNVYATLNLSGVLPNQQGGCGTLSFAQSGIQNGAPDGLALIDQGGAVVQFLSYEGTFTAGSGPAMGMTSTDLGVSESSATPVGDSLQLGGSGADASAFAWQAALLSTFGAVNTGQTFAGCVATDVPPLVVSTNPASGASGVAVDASMQVNFSEDVSLGAAWFDISCTSSGAHTAVSAGGPQSFSLDPDVDFDGDETCTVTVLAAEVVDVDAPPDNMAADFVFSFDTVGTIEWVINEIHADPASGSAGDANGDGIRNFADDEFIEIVNISGVTQDVSGWTLSDGSSVRHTFPTGSTVADGCSLVVFGGGAPTGVFGNSLVQTASGGSLGLSNGGDSVTLNDGSSDAATASYGSEGGDNQSLTLSPDVTGLPPFVRHTLATGSGGTRYSPGTRADGVAFAGCGAVAGGWVINELHADPASGLAGDANGDGTRNSSQDEFAELINNTGSSFDISGWTLSDGAGLRHTFPAGTVVADGCGVLVFGGGTPAGAFGRMPIQTASVGFLGLNNGGDSLTLNSGIGDVVTASYGSAGGDNQSLTLDPDITGLLPFVKHSLATGAAGALYSPGTRIDGSQFEGCPQEREIFEIQGAGLFSPFEDRDVVALDNPVTCLAPNGFFMQTPTARSDGDPNTSDGIFVFTGSAPTVAVGDLVEVVGTVQEFFGFTEISNASVVVTGSDPAQIPPAKTFDATVPSPDPSFPSCAVEYECYESMLVEIPTGTVVASNQEFGSDPFAEVHVVARSGRAFREPGIEFPGLVGLPVWDGNPEVFELDADKLGLPGLNIPARSTFTAKGVIGFEFNHYELWPNELTVVPAPLPVPVRARAPFESTVGSLNLFRLFDDFDDPASTSSVGATRDDFVVSTGEYMRRLAKFAAYIVDVMDSPGILAVQEAEKLEVLQDLAVAINALDPSVNYTSHLIEGNDIGTIDVGFMVRDNVQVTNLVQLGADELFGFDNPPSALHDRPPLLLEGICDGTFPVSVMVLHMRSLGGIEGERTQQKRFEQAESVAQKVQAIQAVDPNVNLIVLGDFNAFEFTDGYVDLSGIVKGDSDPSQNLVCSFNTCTDLVAPDLTDQVLNIDPSQRYSFIFRDSFNAAGSRGDAQILDHAMTSQALGSLVTGLEFARGNVDAAEELVEDDGTLDLLPLRSSDHDGLVLYILKDEDHDGVSDAEDLCLGTVIPEGVPTKELKPNRYALADDDLVFDSGNDDDSDDDSDSDSDSDPGQTVFTTTDTGGCSCEQIIGALNLGNGHTKHGCSLGVMRDWTEFVLTGVLPDDDDDSDGD